MTVTLRGISWDHPRGLEPLLATAARYSAVHADTQVEWAARSLQDFGNQPLEKLAATYDLLVVDHPHVGEAAERGYLLPLNEWVTEQDLAELEHESAGPSHASYSYGGCQWALAIDAAAQVAAYRPDRLPYPPSRWEDVARLAQEQLVLWPLKPVDAICSFLSLVSALGHCPAGDGRLVDDAVGEQSLDLMRSIVYSIPEACLSMDPIIALEEMATGDEAVYSPLLFGYSNYARHGFRHQLLRFTDGPSLDGAPKGTILGGAGVAVSASTRHPEAASRHAAWLASSDIQSTTYGNNGGQPANGAAWRDPQLNAATNGFFADTRLTIERAWVRPRHPGFLMFQSEAGDIVYRFLAEGGSSRSALAQLNSLYERTGPQ